MPKISPLILTGLIILLGGCTLANKNILPDNSTATKETNKIANSLIEKNYQNWLTAKKELDKIQAVITINVNEYLEIGALATSLRDFYKYDEALAEIKKSPPVAEKMLRAINKFEAQADYPEVGEIKTLFVEQVELEKIYFDYLEKNIIAAQIGNSAEQKNSEEIYTKNYQEAMAKGRSIMSLYSNALLKGAKAEGEKMLGGPLPTSSTKALDDGIRPVY